MTSHRLPYTATLHRSRLGEIADNCWALIERHAPHFMVVGGGPLSGCGCPTNSGQALSEETKAALRADYRRNPDRDALALKYKLHPGTVSRLTRAVRNEMKAGR